MNMNLCNPDADADASKAKAKAKAVCRGWLSFSLFNLHSSDAQTQIQIQMQMQMQIRRMLHSVTHHSHNHNLNPVVSCMCASVPVWYGGAYSGERKQTPPRSSPNSNSDRSDSPHGSRLDIVGNPCKVRAPAPRTLDSGMVRPISEVAVCFVFLRCFPRLLTVFGCVRSTESRVRYEEEGSYSNLYSTLSSIRGLDGIPMDLSSNQEWSMGSHFGSDRSSTSLPFSASAFRGLETILI